jgi:hypothetical protein
VGAPFAVPDNSMFALADMWEGSREKRESL